ncbi:ABC protein [Mycena indigotica]|uniref:ABC protein n=1 Tax=Mycena indigotica TaxID=2126181 RepID=A0A8H6S9M2_9AGAR|nr:ABC protein [Mycena indigotica]KAF7295535.1 ABC protein [Mycena indigotica]
MSGVKPVDDDTDSIESGRAKKSTAAQKDLQLDAGIQRTRVREHWWQIWIPAGIPPPPPASIVDAPVSPYVNASLFSRLTYTWISPMMVLGFQRTLQASDLWKMGPEQEAEYLTRKLEESWASRVRKAEEWNQRVREGLLKPSAWRRLSWSFPGRDKKKLEKKWREREASLAWALNDVLGHLFWRGGVFKVVSDTSQLMGPILVKALINFAKDRATEKAEGQHVTNVGRGIAMALGLLCVIVTASICQHQFFFRSMSTGVLARAALTGAVYERALYLTPTARRQLPNSQLLNFVSADISRVDAAAQWFHAAWTAPIQLIVCLIILLVQLGPSALAGFGLFIAIIPLQKSLMAVQFKLRRRSLVWTDARASVTSEIVGAMRIVKYFCYEKSFLERISDIRTRELQGIIKILHSASANIALAFSLPVLAATLAFVTYTSTGTLDVAVIFSSFSLFTLLRQPMMFLPRSLSATADARTALERLTVVMHAEIRKEAPDFGHPYPTPNSNEEKPSKSQARTPFNIDESLSDALVVDQCTWVWEGPPPTNEVEKKAKGKKKPIKQPDDVLPDGYEPFRLEGVSMRVPRGSLVAIVGRVGSGKSSLLQGLVGEMRIDGAKSTWAFGGRVAYCPQTAWIQNATLRDNVVFGQPFDEERYWHVIEEACLLPDLQLLADGDLTEIGEKGINLSGGQKQRVNIARALYYGAEVILFDDPLSAVDANVGKALFHGAIRGLVSRGKTVLLVTHALHFLPLCDYVYVLEHGQITREGTYRQVVETGGLFGIEQEDKGKEFDEVEEEDAKKQAITVTVTVEDAKDKARRAMAGAAGTGKLEGRLMVKEARTTGGVSWSVYGYFMKAGGVWRVVIVVLMATIMQASQVVNSYALVWWQRNTFNKSFAFYQVLYALLGIVQALFTFLVGFGLDRFIIQATRTMHHDAVINILHAQMSFFDTTPMGRILSIFGKDIDTIDNALPMSLRMFIVVICAVVGAILVITIVTHYFIVAALGIIVGYGYYQQFYRAGALEMKRLDSMLRSLLYSHLSESLTGLPTIRSYGEIDRFIRDNKYYIDLENRALFLTVTNQRWLAIRLDAMGSVLVFLVGIFVAVGINGVNAAEVGLILTYTTSLTQTFAMATRQSAEVENYMNSVERVVHYARGDIIPREAPHESTTSTKLPSSWPDRGEIEFNDVTMSYRPGLPNVLHSISLKIKPGEKIGVVGRTGAGKSSLTLCLLRIVEYVGKITVDNVDIGKIGLTDLRGSIAIIPQDPTLFSGTVRSVLDPFSKYDDARLWDALRRSYLVDSARSSTETMTETTPAQHRINLDTVIDAEGANLSVGERSLLSLARALVKDSRVVILDEATASVDFETDNKIQRTIQTQFSDRTLICIAHRLRTIISYDRILVMDAGKIAEFDTPVQLFANENSLFRALCDKSNISLVDIEKAVMMREGE